MKPTIAFFGIGLMGGPMASRLLSAGYRLEVWNRTPGKIQNLLARGAHAAEDPATAASGADVVVTMLSNGPAVTELLFENQIVASMQPGTTLIDMSSIPPALARDHSRQLDARGIHHLDAPVSGGTKGAADGTLAIMVGGRQSAYDAAQPLLEAMGRPTLVGPSGSGQLSKLANQVIVAITIGAVAEALMLAAAGGADPAKVRQALEGGFADSVILRQHGSRMLERAWAPGGLMQTQVKDLRTILAVATELDLQLPLAAEVAGLFEASINAGLAGYDHSALLLEIERRNPGFRVGDKADQPPDRNS
jgi:2-hydroxy-3-oxopropionate reductase